MAEAVVSALGPEPIAVRGLFGSIAAHRHAAPPSAAFSRAVGEDQSADVPLARPDVGEILVTDAPRHRFADRQQQRFRRSPEPHRSQFRAIAVGTQRYAAEHFIAL